ncbi:MAG: hypothetical protein K0S12_171 [Bacteroidetes bacterium]|nr:hypothetical protein [Bacteroidota bacterium]
MATLQMTDDRKTMYTGEWYGLIKIKAKELGADTYIIEQAQVSNTVSVLQFKLFFAGEKFRNANKEKREKNTVHVFKETNSDSAFFYLNNEKILFGKKASYSFPAKKGDYYHIEAAAGKRGGKRLSFPLEKPSGFYLIRTGYVYPGVQVSPEMTPFSAAGAVSVNGLTLRFSPKESVFEFDYDYGKFLKEIYK